MAETIPHISVCVCTFKRPHLLGRLLDGLNCQLTEASFTYSIVIVDNDVLQSSEQVVHRFRNRSALEVSYCVEPEQNIALARNRALVDADGYFIAFIDDDELPAADWLLKLFQACQTFQVDGVLGPVIPHFEQNPPSWVRRGGFCDRPAHPTGFKIDWEEGRTGNLLIRREILDGIDPIFRPEFGSGGEDRNFFRRMIEHGRVFTWCNEAVAYEWIPPLRCKRSFMIRRALLRGKMALNHHRSPGDLAKSLFAVIGYTLALPILFVMGHHFFMKYLIKVCDHSGKLLAFIGLEPVGKKYILE